MTIKIENHSGEARGFTNFTFPQFSSEASQHTRTILTNLAYKQLGKMKDNFMTHTPGASCMGFEELGDLRVEILIEMF